MLAIAYMRDDDTQGSAELVVAYERGIDDLRAAVAGMTKEQVLARPVPGNWSTVECVGHLADTEHAEGGMHSSGVMRLCLAGPAR